MNQAQGLSISMWKVVLWVPRLLDFLDEFDPRMGTRMPNLRKYCETLGEDLPTYQCVALEEGWVITSKEKEIPATSSAIISHSKPLTLLN